MSITPESVQMLLNSGDVGERMRGVNQLRQIDKGTAFELITTAIKDDNARIRYAAVSQMATLGQVDPNQALPILRDRLLNDTETDVQAAAADALGALKLTEAFEDLQQLYFSDSNWLLRFSIVAALGEMGDSRCFDILADALSSDESIVQTVAIGALGELRDPRALPLLLPFATNPDWQVRQRVAQALGSFLDGEQVRSTLEQLAADEQDVVASTAKYSLGLS